MKILIVTDTPFPIGLAPANRIMSYCKGFEKNNVGAEVIIFKPTEKSNFVKNAEVTGKVGNINFKYTVKNNIRSSFFFIKRYQDTIGFINLLKSFFYNFFVRTQSQMLFWSMQIL